MEFVEGIEMGVGAYFNGEDFLEPACLDWEHKRFFPAISVSLPARWELSSPIRAARDFSIERLAKMRPLLKENGYCGYINLNTIVNESGIWPLEFTCRFGYPGYAILDPLQRTSWADLFRSLMLDAQRYGSRRNRDLRSASSSPRRHSHIIEITSQSRLGCRSCSTATSRRTSGETCIMGRSA